MVTRVICCPIFTVYNPTSWLLGCLEYSNGPHVAWKPSGEGYSGSFQRQIENSQRHLMEREDCRYSEVTRSAAYVC